MQQKTSGVELKSAQYNFSMMIDGKSHPISEIGIDPRFFWRAEWRGDKNQGHNCLKNSVHDKNNNLLYFIGSSQVYETREKEIQKTKDARAFLQVQESVVKACLLNLYPEGHPLKAEMPKHLEVLSQDKNIKIGEADNNDVQKLFYINKHCVNLHKVEDVRETRLLADFVQMDISYTGLEPSTPVKSAPYVPKIGVNPVDPYQTKNKAQRLKDGKNLVTVWKAYQRVSQDIQEGRFCDVNDLDVLWKNAYSVDTHEANYNKGIQY